MVRSTSRKLKKGKWQSFPQKTWEQWFAEFINAELALAFYHKNKKWPKKIDLSTLKVVDEKDGGATLSVDMQ